MKATRSPSLAPPQAVIADDEPTVRAIPSTMVSAWPNGGSLRSPQHDDVGVQLADDQQVDVPVGAGHPG